MEWENDIPGCFGTVDQIFANHPLDEGRAFDLLIKLKKMKDRPRWQEIVEAFRRHLQSKGCGEPHIKEQLRRVREHYGPWLE